MQYEARLTDIALYPDRFLELWADNLAVRGDLAAKLRWFYCDSPAGKGERFCSTARMGPRSVASGSACARWFSVTVICVRVFSRISRSRVVIGAGFLLSGLAEPS